MFRMWRFLACPWLFVKKTGPNIREHTLYNKYLIIKKTGKSSGHNEKGNKHKTLAEKDTQFEEKHQQRQQTLQSKWLADFSWLLLDSDIVSYCNIYRKYFDFADRKSLMFIGKVVDRMDTYLPIPMDTTKTVWWIKSLPRLIKMNLIDMRIFFNTLILYLKTTGYSLTGHSYLKFKFEMVFIWAVIT